ncbi:MAG: hypothetical protein J0M33_06735 [Anaerolineae bacterium]|nr:hypothetical protein [Anaerolineae bacterium]
MRWLWIIIVCLAACQPATPTPTATATLPPLAPLTTLEIGGQVFRLDLAMPHLRTAGMRWVRVQYRYDRAHDSPDVIANVMEPFKTQGLKVLLVVVGQIEQMRASPTEYNAALATFLQGVALHNPDAIQVWNEPNIDREWPAGQISGAAYTAMLRAASAAIRAANPQVMVISAAPAPTGFFNGGCTENGCDDNVFIQQMAQAGAADLVDCVGIHYNEGILPPNATSGDPRGNSSHYSRYFPAMLDLYARTFPVKPLCFTELGYLSGEGFTPLPSAFSWAAETSVAEQAAWLAQAVQLAHASQRVRLLMIWNIDSTSYGDDPQAGYAIRRPDGSCPACIALGQG